MTTILKKLWTKSPSDALADIEQRIADVSRERKSLHTGARTLGVHLESLERALLLDLCAQGASPLNANTPGTSAVVVARSHEEFAKAKVVHDSIIATHEYREADAILAPLLAEWEAAKRAVEAERVAAAQKAQELRENFEAAAAKAKAIADRDPAVLAARAALEAHSTI